MGVSCSKLVQDMRHRKELNGGASAGPSPAPSFQAFLHYRRIIKSSPFGEIPREIWPQITKT